MHQYVIDAVSIKFDHFVVDKRIIKRIIGRGHRVMCNFNMHDIPETIEAAIRQLARAGVHYVSVAGDTKTLEAAVRGQINGLPCIISRRNDFRIRE